MQFYWIYFFICSERNKMSLGMTNQQNECVPSKDLHLPGHLPSLIRMKKAWVLSYPLSAQRRGWSDWADAQVDLSLRWAHSYFVGFVMSWLKLCCWFKGRSYSSHLLNELHPEKNCLTMSLTTDEPRHKKTCLRGFQPGKTETGLLARVLKFWI